MICRQCGNEMRDDARFCPHCGALNRPDAESGFPQSPSSAGTPGYAGPEAPVSGGGKKKGLILGGAVAVVAVIAVLAVVVSGVFSSAKGQVEKAMSNSLAAYTQAWEALNIPDLNQLSLDQSVSQHMSLRLEGLNTDLIGYDLSALAGLGLRFDSSLSGADRRLGMELAAFWDDEDIISFQAAAEDDELYFASPALTGGEFYGVNTETLGADLARMTGDDSIQPLSFNFFDLADIAVSCLEQQLEAREALREANKDLWDAVEVKKQGAETLNINGTEQKTTSYRVSIPQAAMEDYADALIAAMEAVDYVKLYEEIFRGVGVPEEDIRSLLNSVESASLYGDLEDELKEFLEELGDVELDVCLYDGYIAAVHWTDTIRRSELDLLLTLGGGGEYVDDLGLELTIDGTTVTASSSGDHGCKSGTFTDMTTVRAGVTKLTSNLRYAPGGTGQNLSWDIGVSGSASVAMEGRLVTTEQSMDLQLEDISVKFLGLELVNLSMDYYAGPYDGQSVTVTSPRLVNEMDSLELQALGARLQANAQSWLVWAEELFLTRLPADVLQMML